MTPDNQGTLRIYLDYDYLPAAQLGTLLIQLDSIFNQLVYIEAPYLRNLPDADEVRLRVSEVHTGGSVLLVVSQGISQIVASTYPLLASLTGGAMALAIMGKVLIRVLDRAEDLRAKRRRNDRTDEQARLDVESRRIEVQSQELRLSGQAGREGSRQLRRTVEDVQFVLAQELPTLSQANVLQVSNEIRIPVEVLLQLLRAPNVRAFDVEPPEQAGESL